MNKIIIKIIKIILWTILILVVLAVLVLGYLGFVPGLSYVLGSDKARDLGLRNMVENNYSDNYKLMSQEIQSGVAAFDPADFRTHPVNVLLTSEEVTSLVQKQFSTSNSLVQNLQIKIHDDGIVEASGILNLKRLAELVPDAKLGEAVQYAKKYQIFSSTAPFYITGTGSATNNQTSINISQIQIGRVTVPIDNETNQAAESLVNRNIRNIIRGLSVTSASFNKGQLHLVGQLPGDSQVLK